MRAATSRTSSKLYPEAASGCRIPRRPIIAENFRRSSARSIDAGGVPRIRVRDRRRDRARASGIARLIEVCPPKDRKSTRLNSSHSQISYAVFCLKKKNMTEKQQNHVPRLKHHV